MPPKVKRGVKSQKGHQTKTKASRKVAKGNRTNRSRKNETPASAGRAKPAGKPPRMDHSKSKFAHDKSIQLTSTSEQFKRKAKTTKTITLPMMANADKSDDDAGNDDDDDDDDHKLPSERASYK